MATKWVEYVMDNRSFGEFILSDQVRDVVVEVCNDIADTAADLTPRRKDRGKVPDGVALHDRFKVNRNAGVFRIGRNVRVKVEVYNDARHAAAVEFGHKGGDGARKGRHRMLGRAGAAYGDFKPDEGWLA
jgi:hypothetical protein